MRYLQSHSRTKFLRRRQSAADCGSSDLETTVDPGFWRESSNADATEGTPAIEVEDAQQVEDDDDPGAHQVGLPELEELSSEDTRLLEEQAPCMVFLCGDQTSIPHQLGFQRCV